ncbi:MAG: hypothetical protein ACE5QF_08300 [Thermoplasmata archaeon]
MWLVIEVSIHMDGSIRLREHGKEYLVVPTGTLQSEQARLLKNLIALSYDIVGDSGEILSIVRHSIFANRVYILKQGEETVLELPQLRDKTFHYKGKEYKLGTKKLRGYITIERDGNPVAWGRYSLSRVRFMRCEGEMKDIIKEIAVGMGINLAGVQIAILGFLAGAA